MKKLISLLIIICLLPCLSGCGSIYSNFREIEQMLVIQTMGLDYIPSGVLLSLASASTGSGSQSAPICLSGVGDSISTAMERSKNYSSQEDLFFSHINHIVIGQEAAERGIEPYLSFICRSPELRIDMPLYIVRGTTAKEAISQASSGSKGISEMLQAVQTNLELRGDGNVFTAAEVLRNLSRYGSALICALELGAAAEESGGSGSGSGKEGSESGGAEDKAVSSPEPERERNVSASGYAVIKDGKLCHYISPSDAVGVGFLLNKVGISDIIIKDSSGANVVLEIDRGGADITPIWAEDGSLHGIDVSARVSAAVLEMGESGNLGNAEYTDQLTSRLEAAVSGKISAVLQLSRKLKADFLGLAGQLEMAAPEKFRAMEQSFEDCLPELELRISVSGVLSHTNDIKGA